VDPLSTLLGTKSRYFYDLDHNACPALRTSIYTADATISAREDRPNTVVGIDNIVDYLIRMLIGVLTVHHGHMSDIQITSRRRRRGCGRWRIGYLWTGSRREDGRAKRLNGYGHCREEYGLQRVRWRIKSLRLTRLLNPVGLKSEEVEWKGTL
jgi:hypothetical protein